MQRTAVYSFLIFVLSIGSASAQREAAFTSIINEAERPEALSLLLPDEVVAAIPPIDMPVLGEREFQMFLDAEQALPEPDASTVIEPYLPEGEPTPTGTPYKPNLNNLPYKLGGKLIMTFAGGRSSCTATFVGATDVLLTAAHCIYNRTNSEWVRDVAFFRAYDNGGGQLFDWSCVGKFQGWESNNPYPWDYAFIKLRSRGPGALGIKGGIPYTTFESIGYPVNYGNNQYMYAAVGNRGSISNKVVQMLGNPMTFGASGGSWIGEGRYAIGTNSHIYTNAPGNMYGPLFDANVIKLFNYVNNGCR
jgi:V8-like Glu-specific endopeptidase